MYSVLIKSGTIIDGLGGAPYIADIAIQEDKIVNIAPSINTDAKLIVNAEGLTVTPGFIDIQNHSDSYWSLFETPELNSLVSQGITSILIGQCGASLAPLISPDALLSIQKWRNIKGLNINWVTFSEFLTTLSERKFGTNVGTLIGYSTLRRAIVGDEVRELTGDEIVSLQQILEKSMSEGAFGLSSGLGYSHEINISDEELAQLAEVVAENNGLLSVHLRNESSEVLESLEAALNIAKRSKVRMKISHLKIRGEGNAKLLPSLFSSLETAYHKGQDVHFDTYPYESTWQPIHSYLPVWAIGGGRLSFSKRIEDASERKKILSELAEHHSKIGDLVLASTSGLSGVVGKTIAALAKNSNLTSEEMLLEIIDKGGSETMVFDTCIKPEVIHDLIRHPLAMISTDGGGFSVGDDHINSGLNTRLVHPRSFGTTAKFLSEMISEDKDSLPVAISKLSSLPAEVAQMQGRGELKIGNFADIVVLDPQSLKDNATLVNPYKFASGFKYVLVNGEVALDQGGPTGLKAGSVLRKNK